MPYSSRGVATHADFHGEDVGAATGARSRRHYGADRPQIALGRGDDRLMTWSTNLNIYRVNRFHPIDLDGKEKNSSSNNSWGNRVQRFDFVEGLLMRNMVDVVEAIFGYVGIESSRDCLLVCRLWYEFLTAHIFKR